MKIKKITEIKFENNDIFFMEIIDKNNILIHNNDASLSIYNSNLELKKNISQLPEFCIYNTYKFCRGEKILFDSSEERSLLFVNLKRDTYSVLKTENIQVDFSRLYYWQDDYLILITRHGDFYHYQDKSNKLIQLSVSFVKNTFAQFYNFYKFYKTFSAKMSINSCDMNFIQCDESSDKIEFYDFKKKISIAIDKPVAEDFTDILYCNKIFVFVYEEVLLICYRGETFRFLPESPEYIFMKARFIKEDARLFLVILLVDRCDFYICKIQKYEII